MAVQVTWQDLTSFSPAHLHCGRCPITCFHLQVTCVPQGAWPLRYQEGHKTSWQVEQCLGCFAFPPVSHPAVSTPARLATYLSLCLLSVHRVVGLLVDLRSGFIIHRQCDCLLWTHWFTLAFQFWMTLSWFPNCNLPSSLIPILFIIFQALLLNPKPSLLFSASRDGKQTALHSV